MLQGYYTNEDLTRAVVPTEELKAMGLSKPSSAIYDYDLSGGFGGPIIKDKIWFYVDGRYARNAYSFQFYSFCFSFMTELLMITLTAKVIPGQPFGKLTFQLAQNVKLAVMGNVQQTTDNTSASGWNIPFDCLYKTDPWANLCFYRGFDLDD